MRAKKTQVETKNMPLFAFVDLQVERDVRGKLFEQRQFDRCIYNCKRILKFARRQRAPIAHFRRLQLSSASDKRVQWMEDFRPRHDEMVFERSLPSCYSSSAFNKFLETVKCPHIVLLGLTAPQACLSTAVDAYHRNHDVTFIFDGSATPAIGRLPKKNAHKFICEVINLYSRVLGAGELLKEYQAVRHWNQ